MKKVIAFLLAAIMVFALAACGGTDKGGDKSDPAASGSGNAPATTAFDGTWPAEQVKFGVEIYDPTDEQFLALKDYFDYLEKCFNVKFIYSEAIADADGELAFINSCADQGCGAFFGYYNVGAADAIKACTDRGMYYIGSGDYYEEVKDNELYLGCYKLEAEVGSEEVSGDYYGGYLLGKSLAEGGYNHIMYCNGGAAFVQFFKDRQAGFLQGLKDGGYDKFNESTDILEGFPDSEAWFASQAQMLAQDFDAVASSFNIALFFQAEGERLANGEAPFAMAAIGEVNDTYKDFMDAGCIDAIVYDCEELVFGCHFGMMMNAVLGNPEMCKNADGTPLKLSVQRWLVTDAETFDAIYDYHASGNYYANADQVANIIKAYNPDATTEDMCKLYNKTLEEALAK